jgi:hypothetical protein
LKPRNLLFAALLVSACAGAEPSDVRDGGAPSPSLDGSADRDGVTPSSAKTVVFTPIAAGQASGGAHRVRLSVGAVAVRGTSSTIRLRYVLGRDHR